MRDLNEQVHLISHTFFVSFPELDGAPVDCQGERQSTVSVLGSGYG